MKNYFFYFLHNFIAHPFLCFFFAPRSWRNRFHNWTAQGMTDKPIESDATLPENPTDRLYFAPNILLPPAFVWSQKPQEGCDIIEYTCEKYGYVGKYETFPFYGQMYGAACTVSNDKITLKANFGNSKTEKEARKWCEKYLILFVNADFLEKHPTIPIMDKNKVNPKEIEVILAKERLKIKLPYTYSNSFPFAKNWWLPANTLFLNYI